MILRQAQSEPDQISVNNKRIALPLISEQTRAGLLHVCPINPESHLLHLLPTSK